MHGIFPLNFLEFLSSAISIEISLQHALLGICILALANSNCTMGWSTNCPLMKTHIGHILTLHFGWDIRFWNTKGAFTACTWVASGT